MMRRSNSLSSGRDVALLALAGTLLAFLLMALNMPVQAAEGNTDIGYQVKAAYLYKFCSFVEWPEGAIENAASPLVIGVMGADEVADALAHIVNGRKVQGHPISVRKLGPRSAVSSVHLLFAGRLEKSRLIDIFSELKGRPILTITDSDEAYALGGMINFSVVDDRMRFEVSLKPIEMSGIKISALMMAAAVKVVKGSL